MPLRLYKSTMHSISDDSKMLNELSINSKSITRFSCKSNQIKIIKRERLSGGADVNDIKESVKNVIKSTDAVTIEPTTVESNAEIPGESFKKFSSNESTLIDKQIEPLSGPCCICATHLTSDDKINEIIEYAHQNLQDAGKALATLGENFEHGLKLAIVDVLGRIQQWSTTVQNKLDVCKEDIERLRKELLSQICAINDKEDKIRKLNKQLLNSTGEINQLKQQIAECIDEKTNYKRMLTEKHAELERTKNVELEPEPLVVEAPKPIITQTNNLNNMQTISPINTQTISPINTQTINPINAQTNNLVNMQQNNSNNEDLQIPLEKSIEETKEIKRRCSVQTREKDKERKRREIELESEIGRLRKENEKLMKERIDYENAIQRALLRGVSSLNVEALRVLRCPPIPCCSPCAPCPMSFIPTYKDSIPRPTKMKKFCSSRTASKECNNSYGNGTANGAEKGNNMKYNQCDNVIKRPCASPCCPAGKNPKGSNNSMFFLLHQGDAENVCKSNERSSPRPCGSPIMKRIEISPCLQFTRPC